MTVVIEEQALTEAAFRSASLPATEPERPAPAVPSTPSIQPPREPNAPFTPPACPVRRAVPTPDVPVPAHPDPAPVIQPKRRERSC